MFRYPNLYTTTIFQQIGLDISVSLLINRFAQFSFFIYFEKSMQVPLKENIANGRNSLAISYLAFYFISRSKDFIFLLKILFICYISYLAIVTFFFFFKLGFTPCKAEQPLRGMELQEKKHKKNYRIQKICLERTYS